MEAKTFAYRSRVILFTATDLYLREYKLMLLFKEAPQEIESCELKVSRSQRVISFNVLLKDSSRSTRAFHVTQITPLNLKKGNICVA